MFFRLPNWSRLQVPTWLTFRMPSLTTKNNAISKTPSSAAQVPKNVWIADSGADQHLTNDRNCFQTYVEEPTTFGTAHRGHTLNGLGRGLVILVLNLPDSTRNELELKDVFHCPDTLDNLLSLSQLARDSDFYGSWSKHSITLKSPQRGTNGVIKFNRGDYVLQHTPSPKLIDCAICKKNHNPEDSVFTPCNHLFDRDCLDDWIHARRCCPLCEQQVHLDLKTRIRCWRRYIVHILSKRLSILLCTLFGVCLVWVMIYALFLAPPMRHEVQETNAPIVTPNVDPLEFFHDWRETACKSFDAIARAPLPMLCPDPDYLSHESFQQYWDWHIQRLEHTQQGACTTNSTELKGILLHSMARYEEVMGCTPSPSAMMVM